MSLAKYLQDVKELPDEVLLGRIVMFTISDNPVDRDQMAKWFDDLGLNDTFVPPPIKAIDAFKKATSEIDESTYSRHDGTDGVLLSRDLGGDRSTLTRRIVREVRDAQNRRLAYDEVVDAVFYKAKSVNGRAVAQSERVRFTRINDGLEPQEIPHIDKAIANMQTAYQRHANFLDGQKVRYVVRQYLKYLNAIEIKGGVYFVHKSRTAELMKLRELVNRCGPGCRMDQIPLVDTENERDIIIEAFQREAEEALDNLVREISHVRSTRKSITPEAYAKLKKEYDKVVAQALEYSRTLRITQDRTSAAADLALDALTEMQMAMLDGD